MKKKVTNTHKEPIVLPLLRPNGTCRFPQRCNVNLIDTVVVDESEVSPEMEKIAKRGKIKIEDAPEPKPKPAYSPLHVSIDDKVTKPPTRTVLKKEPKKKPSKKEDKDKTKAAPIMGAEDAKLND